MGKKSTSGEQRTAHPKPKGTSYGALLTMDHTSGSLQYHQEYEKQNWDERGKVKIFVAGDPAEVNFARLEDVSYPASHCGHLCGWVQRVSPGQMAPKERAEPPC